MNLIISFVRPKGVWLFPRCSPSHLGKTSLGGHAVGGPCSPEASRRLPQPGGFRRQRRGGRLPAEGVFFPCNLGIFSSWRFLRL